MQQLAKFLGQPRPSPSHPRQGHQSLHLQGKARLEDRKRSRSASASSSRSRPTGTDDDAFGAASADLFNAKDADRSPSVGIPSPSFAAPVRGTVGRRRPQIRNGGQATARLRRSGPSGERGRARQTAFRKSPWRSSAPCFSMGPSARYRDGRAAGSWNESRAIRSDIPTRLLNRSARIDSC